MYKICIQVCMSYDDGKSLFSIVEQMKICKSTEFVLFIIIIIRSIYFVLRSTISLEECFFPWNIPLWKTMKSNLIWQFVYIIYFDKNHWIYHCFGNALLRRRPFEFNSMEHTRHMQFNRFFKQIELNSNGFSGQNLICLMDTFLELRTFLALWPLQTNNHFQSKQSI